MPEQKPVTMYDATAAACIERLEALQATEPLTASLRGGGAGEGVNLHTTELLLIARDEVRGILRLLRQLPPDATILGQEG